MWFFLILFEVSQCLSSEDVDLSTNGYDCAFCQPEQIHIAFGENSNDIVIMWSTLDRDRINSLIYYGTEHMDQRVVGDSWLFKDGGPARREQCMHRVQLNNLKFNTTYKYRVGSEYGWSEELSFKTPPAGIHWVVSAAIYGDLGLQNAHSLPYLQEETEQGLYDFVIHVGDFAYDLDSDDATVGDQFMRQIQPIASLRPYMTCPGNHEAAYNFSNYKNRFSMPHSQQNDNMYYSWNVGPVHFVAFSTEFYYDNDTTSWRWWRSLEQQYNWIKADLTDASRSDAREKRPWIIMYGHRPMYCSSTEDECTQADVPHRQGHGLPEPGFGIEPLLRDFGVDLIIFGHEHSYERSLPLYDHTVYNGSKENPYLNPQAPVHLITGSAGCAEGTYKIHNKKPWMVFTSSDYGYTRLRVLNQTHLHLEQVSVDKKGKVIDSFFLVREVHAAYATIPDTMPSLP